MSNSKYPIEKISDSNQLFLRINKAHLYTDISDEKQMIKPTAFNAQPVSKGAKDLSVNWSKYSTPQKTRDEVKHFKNKRGIPKDPGDYGVVSFVVLPVRKIGLEVIHKPSRSNQAHSIIYPVPPMKNHRDTALRLKLRDLCKWEIKLTL